MCGDDDAFAGADLRRNFHLPVRHHAYYRVFQAFRQWQFLRQQRGIAQIARRMTCIVHIERRRRHIVGAAPQVHLLIAEFRRRLCLVQALQGAVVTLVQAPVLDDGYPAAVKFFLGKPQGANRARQQRGIAQIEVQSGRLHQLSCLARVSNAFFSQVNVDPAGKSIFQIPRALAVSHQYQFFHVSHQYGGLGMSIKRAGLALTELHANTRKKDECSLLPVKYQVFADW